MDPEIASRAELIARAGSEAAARRWLSDGDWWRICRGVYAPRAVADGPRARLAGLSLCLPPGTAVSHRAALWVFGVDVGEGLIDVTVPRGRHLKPRDGIRGHSAALPEDELCLVDGVLVVSPSRAVVDVARRESRVEAVVVADAALRLGVVTEATLASAVGRAWGLRNADAARELLRHVEPRTESPMETRCRLLLVAGGLPRPRAQYDVYDAGGHVGRGDFELAGVIIEFDGREQRLDRGVFVRDRQRQNRIADTGLEIRRFTAADVYRRPAAAVCAEVQRAMQLARGRDRSGLRCGPDTLPRPRRLPPLTLAQQRRSV